MKLVTFQTKISQEPLFGLVINEKFVVSFAAIMKKQEHSLTVLKVWTAIFIICRQVMMPLRK